MTIHRNTIAIHGRAAVETNAYAAGQRISFYKTCDGWTCYNHDEGKHYQASAAVIRHTMRDDAEQISA